jgi:CBS domain containing-hemolysin-like protein
VLFEWLMVAVGLLLTVGTGLFVASEFALVNLDRNDLETRRDRGEVRLDPTIAALRITSTHLSSAQLGITLTTLLTGFTFEPAISALLSAPLSALGVSAMAVDVIGAVAGIAIATVFSMVVGELVPKSFALALPLATAKRVIPFQTLFTAVFKPVVLLFNRSSNAIVRLLGVEPKEELSGARSAEELSSLVRRSALEGRLDQDHATLLGRTLRFSDHSAADVMTPRVQMAKLSATDTAETVLATSQSSGFSRFPVIGDGVDDIVGVVHVKWAFALPPEQRAQVLVADLQVDPLRVPESMGVDTLLGLLRRGSLQLAVVTDEYGGTAGLVTLEDLVEELVGDLQDEYDRNRPRLLGQGDEWLLDGALRPDELAERTGISVPESDEYETLAGFVADQLDRLPEVGDEVQISQGLLRVEQLDGRRVDRLRYRPNDPAVALDADSVKQPEHRGEGPSTGSGNGGGSSSPSTDSGDGGGSLGPSTGSGDGSAGSGDESTGSGPSTGSGDGSAGAGDGRRRR